jgi:hypothetical protein
VCFGFFPAFAGVIESGLRHLAITNKRWAAAAAPLSAPAAIHRE